MMTNKNFPLDWYRDCLARMVAHLNHLESVQRTKQIGIDQLKSEVDHLALQIKEAEQTGKTSFDLDTYLKRDLKA
jgi:hypothetical protein